MSIFTHEKIKIDGLPMLKSLLSFKVDVKADTHGKLVLEGYGEESAGKDVEKDLAGSTIEVWPLDDDLNTLENPIFCGVITDYEIDINENVSKIKITALTGTYLLDLEKKSRSFQDVSMTYKDVVKKVLNGTGGSAIFSVGGDRTIGKPLIQYHETDWEFIKRLASHFNSPIIPDTKSTKAHLWFGINEHGDEREVSDEQFTVGISENFYKASGKSYGAPHNGFLYYDVNETNNYFIGDKTNFRSSNLLICEKTVSLEKSVLSYGYVLGVKTLLSKNIEYNAKITGMSLIGTVKKTASETVNIQLDIDGANGGYEYPYNWAPTSGNTMYCMPKVETKVTLLLPNDDERDATATNAPRENGGVSGSCSAMADPNQRAFVSEHNKKMNLFPELMQFMGTGTEATTTTPAKPLHTTIEDEKGITIQSHKSLLVLAKRDISFESDKISLYSPSEVAFYKNSIVREYEKLILPIGTGGKKAEATKGNPPTGGESSYILSDGFNFKALNNVKKGYDYKTHPPFNDAPEEGKFDGWQAFGNVLLGLCVAALATIAIVATVALVAATAGVAAPLAAIAIGAAVSTAATAVVMVASDYRSGNVRSTKDYVFNMGIGAVTGAVGGALGSVTAAALTRFGFGLVEGGIEFGANWAMADKLGIEKMSILEGLALMGVNGLANVFFGSAGSEGVEQLTKDALSEGAEQAVKEGVSDATEKALKESLEDVVEEVTGDIAKEGTEQIVKEGAEQGAKETTENSLVEAIEKGAGKADPVSALTGTVFYDDTDFSYQGVIPFNWTRGWRSNNHKIGVFGYGTSFSYGMYVREEENTLIYLDNNSSEIKLEKIGINSEIIDRPRKLKLSYDGEKYTIFSFTTREHTTFEKVAEAPIYKLTKIENELKENSINFEYDQKGYLQKVVDTTGKEYLVSTNPTGQITEVKVNGEILVEYKYDDNLNILGLKDISGGETFIEYDDHLMVSKTSKAGDTFYWKYDREGTDARCIHTYGENKVLDYHFKYNDGNTEYTDSLGNTSILYYDENKVPYKEELANGAIKTFKYNEFNELVEEVSPDREKTSYKYNTLGLIEEVTTATGGVHKFDYLENGKISKVTNPLGATREWVYDESGKLVEETALNGAKTFYEYQEKGLISKIIEGEEDQLVTTLEYDDKNNVTKAILPTGAVESWEYDKDGNCTSNTTPLGTTTKIEYDKCSRISKIYSPDGNVTELEYNYYNKVTRLKDKEKVINLKYDSLANVVERKEDDKTIGFAYDTEGRLVEVTNEVGEKYKFVRDQNGDVVEELGYDNVWKKYRRTKGGKVRGTKRSNTSEWTSISYDKSGLLSSILYPDGREDSYKYGIMGELLEAESSSAKLTFTYDEIGNLLSESQDGHTITSEYNSKYRFSQRTKILSSLGLDLDLIHNELGQLENIEAGFGTLDKWRNSFKYNDIGQLTSRSLSENLTESLSYDNLGRIKNQSVARKGINQTSKVYTWDIGNRIKSIVDEVTNIGLEYSYDKYGNLEMEKCSGLKLIPEKATIQRSFDKAGNVYSLRSKADREYKTGGQLIRKGRSYYLYNDAGDLIEKKDHEGKKWLYEYGANGLLSKVTRPDKNEVTFEYDALGRRLSKSYKGKTTKFLWDGNKVLHEWREYENTQDTNITKISQNQENPTELTQQINQPQPQNIVTWLYKDGSFVPIGKLTENDSYSIVTDHLGTPTEMYNSKGERVWKVIRDIYGRERHRVGGETAETDCQVRYQGQYEDYETGLYYNRFRYYMPAEGMYSQRDPIGLAGGNPSLYGYVWDSTKQVDIFGLDVGQGVGDYNRYKPMSGSDWDDYFKAVYGDDNVIRQPNGNHVGSVDDLYEYPELLNGIDKNYLDKMLGDEWVRSEYGSNGLGWQFNKNGEVIFYHAGDGIHDGAYYGIKSSKLGGTVKIVDGNYNPLNEKNTILIYVDEVK